jgi:hypothetical protein
MTSNVRLPLMDLLLILLLMMAGFFFGSIFVLSVANGPVPFIVLIGSFFGAVAVLSAYVCLHAAKTEQLRQRRLKRTRVRRPVSPHPPAPFQSRLARFTGKSQQEVMVPHKRYESKMPFWTRVNRFVRLPPKSRETIRRSLLAIRRVLGH